MKIVKRWWGRAVWRWEEGWNWLMVGALIMLEVLAFVMIRIGGELMLNCGSEILGIIVTVVVIDWVYHLRGEKALKERLIREMGSRHNSIALKAVIELSVHGWLEDGSLRSSQFYEADLSDAYLFGVDFEGAGFHTVNFSNANLRHANFKNASFEGKIRFDNAILAYANFKGSTFSEPLKFINADDMAEAILPDGKKYDGRYRLKGDLEMYESMRNEFGLIMSWAEFYGISEKEYEEGQRWADENLGKEGV
jgi:hypothetical protein